MSSCHTLGPGRKRVWLRRGLATLAVAVALVAIWYWRPSSPRRQPDAIEQPSAPLPPLTSSPFQNTKPGVAYVGDDACAACHPSLFKSYRQHAMGRSFAPMAQAAVLERYDAQAGNPVKFEAYQLEVRQREGQVAHKQICRDSLGNTVAEIEHDVSHAMGSGAQGRSYLINRDGFLFQSPISWFTHKQRWDVSPGYEKLGGLTMGFSRAIQPRCVFCHCNDAAPVEHSVNRYADPPFQRFAIGCERCHGPGEIHVAQRRKGWEPPSDIDPSIVNPRHLSPPLREAVCQQCHLQGEAAVPRRGRSLFDYRPGLPLHEFLAVYVTAPEKSDNYKAVSQVEQMHVSRCFQAGGGKMGCITCHDPHSLPAAGEKTAFYRQRCLQCHTDQSCSLPSATRQETKGNDCAACHMPRGSSTDVVHAAITDHRIVRSSERPPRLEPTLKPGDIPLLHFHRHLLDGGDPEVPRDLGIAVVMSAKAVDHGPLQQRICQRALPLLKTALDRDSRDLAALESIAFAHWKLRQFKEGFHAACQALTVQPRREVALELAVEIAEEMGQGKEALAHAKRLLDLNPWNSSNHFRLARLHAGQEDWPQAEQHARNALRVDPFDTDARLLLVSRHVAFGDRAQAQADFEAIVALKPAHLVKLRAWFAERMK